MVVVAAAVPRGRLGPAVAKCIALLVRLADAAYPSNISLPDKLRALLVQLWRSDGAPQPGSPRKGDDLARAVVDMWRGDDYRDYLAVGGAVADGVPALERLSPARRSPGVR